LIVKQLERPAEENMPSNPSAHTPVGVAWGDEPAHPLVTGGAVAPI
jgi:hypothetical protein